MKHFKQFFVFALLALFSVGAWGAVESGTTYSTPSATGVPSGWTSVDGSGTTYIKLTESTHYISTDEFCQNGFTSIKIKARKFGGPSAAQGVISVEWFETGGSSTVLATVSPTGTSLTDYTVSDLETVTGNKSGYIKISCKDASGGKGCGVSEVTITYTAGTCGSGTPTCATPTFSPVAGSYEGTQNVTISSTTGATIYYTIDGSDPTTSGTKQTYSAAIPVSADMTIKAYATLASYDDSEVATAAYVITEGPDVTLNLLDDGWGFPTSKVVEETSYTNGDYTIKVAGTTGNGFRTYGTYFMLGQNGAYLELPSFANPIEKIVVSGNSNGSAAVTWNIFKGDDAVSTAATGCKNDAYTFEIDEPESSVVYRIKVTSAANLQIKTIKIFYGAAAAVAKPTISGDENFVGSTSVSISHADADAIYYTTDGSDPKTSGTKLTYSAPFIVNADGTTTVKAYAVKGGEESQVAEKEFTKVSALESLAALLEATTSDETAFNVVIENWVVTGVSGSRAWIADAANEKGILLYKSGHNFEAGNKLNGVVLGTKTKLYQGYPELTSLVSTDVTVTAADDITPRAATLANLVSGYNKEQGTVVTLTDVTYTAGTGFTDGENTVALNTQLYTPTMVDGATYTITGVVRYDNNEAISIMPRKEADVVKTSDASLPEVTGLAALKAKATGTSYLLNLTNAVVTLVDGNNAFIEDATAGALIYFSGHGYAAGDKLNGQYEVTTATYQGKFEITAMEAQTGATKVADAEIPVTTMTIAQLNANFAANESKRIKIVGVTVTDAVESGDATARTGEISDGENTITLYAGKSGVTAAENANIDVIGYPGFHNTDEQLTVWAQADITVNVKEDPELAYTPASESIELGDSWSAPTLANPHSLPLSFSSDKEALATVTDAGVIALVADATGTATITASFAGNATYNAGSATYTITVSVPDGRKKATLENIAETSGSFDKTDITYAAYQGDGTTPPAANGTDLRLYKPATGKETGGYIVISAVKGCTIDEVVVTNGDSKATTIGCSTTSTLATSGEAYAQNASVSFESLNSSVVYIDNIGSERMDIIKIEVYYTGEPASVHHLTLSGTYPTEFEQGDVFDYTGLVVTAAYDEEETDTKDVTSAANVSTPDMNTIGEKTITVSYGGKYTEYTITVNAAAGADDISGVWTLVTDATALEAGMKVIIAQHVDADGAIYTMGDQKSNNRGAVESAVAGSILTPNFKTRVFELEDAGSGMFALKAVEDSKYLYAAASGNNYMKSQESIDDNAKWTITVDADGVASIVATNSSNRNVMQFNSGSSLFSCYGSASQTDIALYTRAKEKREGFTVGKLATVCVPYAVAQEDIIGADVYEIAGKNEAGKIVFDQVTTGGMEAGVAYLVQAKAETATFYYSGDAVAAPKNEGKALKGTFDGIDIDVADAANVYFFKDNALWSAKETGVKILANRAYLQMDEVQPVSSPNPAPGRRRITMDVHGQNAATGMDELNASEAPRKMIIDGKMYIFRGEKMYNASGILVK